MSKIFGEQYLRYANEMWGRRLIQADFGFVTFDVGEESVYIADMFIEPDERGLGRGSELEDLVIEIALAENKNYLECKVHRSDKGWRENYTIYTEHRGYHLRSENDDCINLIKNIGGLE
jgi:GNAT superfamily N-acetyltransferase